MLLRGPGCGSVASMEVATALEGQRWAVEGTGGDCGAWEGLEGKEPVTSLGFQMMVVEGLVPPTACDLEASAPLVEEVAELAGTALPICVAYGLSLS